MKSETWVMISVAVFFAVIAPIYWLASEDPTGTVALTMAFLLCALSGFYLAVVTKQIPERPEDRNDGEIADGAGEQGFFPPYSWWPLFCAAALAVCALGIVIGWWLFIMGVGVGAIIPHGVEVFVGLDPIDLRWGFDRLVGVVAEKVGRDARSGALFAWPVRKFLPLNIGPATPTAAMTTSM